MNGVLVQRLDDLKDAGIIAGWQRGGGPNYGLSAAPLPWLIFPAAEGPARAFYDAFALGEAIAVLEEFGPMQLAPRRIT